MFIPKGSVLIANIRSVYFLLPLQLIHTNLCSEASLWTKMSTKILQSSIPVGSCPHRQAGMESQCSTQYSDSVEGTYKALRICYHGSNYCVLLCFRMCPGKYLAPASLWIAVATMLSTLHITKAKDEQGNEIVPLMEFDRGLVRCVYFCGISIN